MPTQFLFASSRFYTLLTQENFIELFSFQAQITVQLAENFGRIT